MRKGIKNFCNGLGSTSTLDQRRPSTDGAATTPEEALPTLEEMILRLEIEEAIAARSRSNGREEEDRHEVRRRRSCVDSSDRILRSAKDALNQYPRFSLDGKDAMFRSSFGNFTPRRRSVCGGCDDRRSNGGPYGRHFEEDDPPEPPQRRPRTVAGEAVVWCEPGVVAKLMGLESVPVPVRRRKKMKRRETGRRGGATMDLDLGSGYGPRYYLMKPISAEPVINSPTLPFLSTVHSPAAAAAGGARKFRPQRR